MSKNVHTKRYGWMPERNYSLSHILTSEFLRRPKSKCGCFRSAFPKGLCYEDPCKDWFGGHFHFQALRDTLPIWDMHSLLLDQSPHCFTSTMRLSDLPGLWFSLLFLNSGNITSPIWYIWFSALIWLVFFSGCYLLAWCQTFLLFRKIIWE